MIPGCLTGNSIVTHVHHAVNVEISITMLLPVRTSQFVGHIISSRSTQATPEPSC